MLSKRLIACLDVRDGKLAKSVKFVDTRDIGDPVTKARQYYEAGIDELVFYDITASSEGRGILLEVVSRVAAQVFIPFSVGGGLRTVDDCQRVLLAGAEKINVNSAAVQRPNLIAETAKAFGAQAVVLSMDVLRVEKSPKIPSGYEIVIHGGRTRTGLDAIAWARRGESLGAGEMVVNSIDADGTKTGYELTLTRLIAEAVGVPVIASGGGGQPEHLYAALTTGKADAVLVASMLHFGEFNVSQIKKYLAEQGIKVRRMNDEK
ncbi:MAG: imidazole glycerol phosphate synthase subunit HisF [Anaerolineae bacterium CG_4_9_14_3_um_filter_57_17]|nr:imidazole glycerol phosphate synthase subunit HisF [bacterium]NCT19535.1 imidazole glycerol phosphate synthase subunit HisF [bacterium]OIO83239.1 MAG: imidazole glycerol phosphate synthase subunit HisF [Anaerolineae bacterium CG2_30_57_67]PJB66539.1 MAG: imidazole glycerol phosphate synthase subunit HisF [Anaerolineae bacterium CG_4_9_14_3_um_filter_57_17]